jgi:uncharacterized protein (DUF2267 family)
MSTTTHVTSLDATVHTTNEWLGRLSELLSNDHEDAYAALRGTLHTLRDALDPGEATDLAAQLPMLLRGVFFTGWTPADTPVRFDRRTFLEAVRSRGGLQGDRPDPVAAARATLQVLREKITTGQVEDTLGRLS